MEILNNNLPAWQVIIPLIAALLCAISPWRVLAWGIATAAAWASFACSVLLLQKVLATGAFTYVMGGWPVPFGIEYRVDLLSAFILPIISGMGAVVLLFAYKNLQAELHLARHSVFYAMFLLCLTGLLGMTITNDAFNIYVFLEIASLATYAMIAMGKDRRALLAAFEYLILGTVGATFILIAIGLLYMMTGTLNISDLSDRLPALWNKTPVKAAVAFFVIGLALKIAIFPLHLWLTNAYTYAPSTVSAFLSATATKVSIYVLIRVLFCLFKFAFAFELVFIGKILMTLSLFAIGVGSLVAIFQQDIKRILAYSSVAQVGYIILGIAVATEAGLTASLTTIVAHALAKGALFMAIGCVAMQIGNTRLCDVKGLGQVMPWTCAAFVVAGLSLVGMPMTAGFIGKWYLFKALLDAHLWPVFAVVLVSSILTLVYIWRVVETFYFVPRPRQLPEVGEASALVIIPLWLLVLASLALGIYTAPIAGVAGQAAHYLYGTPL